MILEKIYIYMNSVFGFDYQNHIQTDNQIFSSVQFGFDQFASVMNSVHFFSIRFGFSFRLLWILPDP